MTNFRLPLSLLLLGIFALSGLAGLIYQSIWSQYLALFLGHAAYAQALVLALFMGGMALGAAVVSQRGTKWRNLLKTYALVELVIGLFGLTFHLVFITFLDLSYDIIMPALGGTAMVGGYKWLAAGLLILPQTILLGMTFPLMGGGLMRRFPGHDGQALGGLYFANSFGAAIGVLLATFALIPTIGLPGAMVTAGIINLLVAAAALWLSRGQEPARQQPAQASSGASPNPLLRMVLIATFLSSAASFVYEIFFVRMLGLAVGSTLHAFELMLAAFIAGIALGALWIRRRADDVASPLRLAGTLQILMGLTALAGMALYSSSFHWVGWMIDALNTTDGGYALYNLGTAIISIAIMLPTAFFAGTTLPLYTVTLLRNGEGEEAIGKVYAWNTLGAILGVFAAIHFLLPKTGLQLGLTIAAMIDIAIGIALYRFLAGEQGDRLRLAVSVSVMLVAAFIAINVVNFDPRQLSSGVYRSGNPRLNDEMRMLYYQDGKTASVTLFASPSGVFSVATNGKVDAGVQMAEGQRATPDEATMLLSGALPMAYHPDARTAAVIGLGSGITSHTLLANPAIERVDTIEIEQAMVEAAQGFGKRVARAFEDPRSNIIIDDAKSYLAGQRRRYDIIVSEPSNPWISGVGNLFSREFYRFIPRVIAEDGVFVQWLQLYEIDEPLVVSALQGLLEQFPHVEAYLTNSADLLMVASQKPLLKNPDLAGLYNMPLSEELIRINLHDAEQLQLRQIGDHRLLTAITKMYPGPVNSDYHPVLSLQAPSTRFKHVNATTIMRLAELYVPLLQWLEIRSPLSSSVPVVAASHYPGEVRTSNARTLRNLILQDKAATEGEIDDDLQFFGFARSSCWRRSLSNRPATKRD